MRFRAGELAQAVGGSLTGPDVDIAGAAIDSRLVTGGQLFVPVVAERDGHDFVAAAVAAGSPAYFSARGRVSNDATAIEVASTAQALLDLGRSARDRLPARVIGVTGSVGKTTVKELAAAALRPRFRVAASSRSFNNELGVPITLANAPDDVEAVVVEMGSRGPGHIDLLCRVARPTIGVVTVVAGAHTEMFGTLDAVASAKSELVASLPATGTAVLNADDDRVATMAGRTAADVVTYSATGGGWADVVAEHLHLDDRLRPSFDLVSPWGRAPVTLALHGAHNVGNALAAATAAMSTGVPVEQVAEGLGRARPSSARMELGRAPSGLLVLNDAYNANPTSTEAALRSLAQLPARRRIAVLGLMAELGPTGPAAHRRIGDLARSLGLVVVAVDVGTYGTEPVTGAEGALTALDHLGPLGEGDAVLVKASRVSGLEQVAEALLAGGGGN